MTKIEDIYSWVKRNYSKPDTDWSSPVPSIHMLIKQRKASKGTVEKALVKLVDDGILRAEHGRGYFPIPMSDRPGSIDLALGPSLSIIDIRTFHWWIFSGITKSSAEIGRDIKIFSSLIKGEDKTLELFLKKLEKSPQIYGVLVFDIRNDTLFTGLRDLKIPAVSLDYDSSRFGIDCIITDSKNDSSSMTEMLIRKGHRNIAIVPGKVDASGKFLDPDHQLRLEGYIEKLAEHGIPLRDENIIIRKTTILNEIGERISAMGTSGPTALIFDFPELARFEGFLTGNSGIELGVICGDGYEIPDYVRKALIMKYDFQGMGSRGVKMLSQRIKLGTGRAEKEIIKPVFELVNR